MNNTKAMQAVAVAAIEWNRARLVRIAIVKQQADKLRWFRVGTVDDARKAEAKAKAALRKACAVADPASVVIDLVPIPQESLGGLTRGGGFSILNTDQ